MRAMVLAAGLGTRLRPLTYEITKPMVPVLDRPVMAHILDLLDRHGFEQVIANLHYFPETIREHFGDRLEYRYEPELLGTAGGVRACAEFFGEEPFLVISGDALTDIDLGAFVARHRASGGIATLAVKRVDDTREFGVVLHDREGRITGFQEKPSARGGALGPRQLRDLHLRPGDLRLLPRAAVRRLGPGRVPGAAGERRSVPHPRGRRVLERRRLAGRAAPGHVRRAGGQAAPGDGGEGGQPRRDPCRRGAVAAGHRGGRSRVDRPRRVRSARACA